MKKIVLLLISCFFIISCEKDDSIYPSRNIVNVYRPISNFSSIELHDGLELIITQDNIERVEIEANENIIQYIESIKTRDRVIFKIRDYISFTGIPHIKIYVSAKIIDELIASGGSIIRSRNTLYTDRLITNLSGGSRFNASLDCTEFISTLSGGSSLTLRGISDFFDLYSSGGSTVYGENFLANDFICNISGGSSADLNVNHELQVTASGGSSILYGGYGRVVYKDLTGGSYIKKVN